MYKVQSGVPIPVTKRAVTTTRRKYPFETMAVDDMFFVEGRSKNTLSTHVSTVGKQLGRKFATRLCYMKKTADGWEVCDKSDTGAILGVGVWRKA